MDGYINAGAGIYCELFSCYMPLGQHSTAYDRETEALRTALILLNLYQDKFEKAVIFSGSKAALLLERSAETVISAEARDCHALIRQLKAKHKQIALQWVPGRCHITGNEHADALDKKGAKIIQTHTREASYHSIKLQAFQRAYRHELETKLSQKPWRQEIDNTPDWPRRKAVAGIPVMRRARLFGNPSPLHRNPHLPLLHAMQLREPMDRNHLGQRTALASRTDGERY